MSTIQLANVTLLKIRQAKHSVRNAFKRFATNDTLKNRREYRSWIESRSEAGQAVGRLCHATEAPRNSSFRCQLGSVSYFKNI